MTRKHFISTALLIALLAQLTACGGAAETPAGDTTAAADTTAAITETERLTADIPTGLDYKGYKFRVLARATPMSWDNYDLVAESETGDLINDAVFKRNLALSEKLNVEFVRVGVEGYDVVGPATKSILAGTDEYDIIMPSITDAANLAQQDMLTPLQEMTYMDLDKPWYDQRCIDELEICGKNYLFFSDITVSNLDAIWIYVFNKNMIDDFKLTDPYELVANGKWTMDKMTEMSKAVTVDLNGDSKMDKSDRWGMVAHDYVITASYVGAGERIATADSKGNISLTMNNERIYDVIDSIVGLQDYWIRYSLTARKHGDAPPVGFEPSDNYAELLSVFTSGNALFMGECMQALSHMRDSNVDFGVLPSPKLDEKQDGYYAAVNYIAAAMCVPKTVTDFDRTSAIIEAWAAESHYTLMPAYYDISTKSKFTRDTISADMLDMILNARSYDLGIYYNWGQLSDRFCHLVYTGSDAFASLYDANKAAAQDALDKFVSEVK